ncbi:unnamed protein product [Paramecium octaurelia]|uniref:2-oxoisovalerate dehydrogenase subunit alpha n=1 Tax=Paramecium octaurelia TaxID=43137 RepID=A0A8S1VMR3_PAROT|nr:unnamed protein product [Paramecium octaurelia]
MKHFMRFSKISKAFKEVPSQYVYQINPIKNFEAIKQFRVIDLEGNLVAKEYNNIPKEILNQIFDLMISIEEMDNLLYMSQRQGKISFYMTSFGETATTVGTTAALQPQDFIFPQYREQGSFMWRGFTIEQIVNQCIGNHLDGGKGRQMPVHYGSKDLNIVTVSSPLTTQVPQASGAGYGFRVNGENKIAATWFGEGAASEGDFHSAMNFAQTLKCQTLFLCRNNHYAISTPTDDQFRGDTIAGKAPAYGMRTLKIDGNDLLAVYNGVKYAREEIIKNKEPFFIEFITYRIGDHSTSDHSVLYRSQEEIDSWKSGNNPINRLGLFLKKQGLRQFNDDHDNQIRKDVRNRVIAALKHGSEQQSPSIQDLFTDVYDEVLPHLQEQYTELREHLTKYKDQYPINKFKGGL